MTLADSRLLYFTLVALVAAQRVVELIISRRNETKARAAGATEIGSGHYGWMVTLHSAFLVSCPLEVWLLGHSLFIPLTIVMLIILIIATTIRYAAIASLGPFWTTRVYKWPDQPRIQTGPYRFLDHPNYLAVRLELIALPLIHGAWVTAVVFSLLNAWLLRVRISSESNVFASTRGNGEDRPEREPADAYAKTRDSHARRLV